MLAADANQLLSGPDRNALLLRPVEQTGTRWIRCDQSHMVSVMSSEGTVIHAGWRRRCSMRPTKSSGPGKDFRHYCPNFPSD